MVGLTGRTSLEPGNPRRCACECCQITYADLTQLVPKLGATESSQHLPNPEAHIFQGPDGGSFHQFQPSD